jgi:ectoine hydroxylase-related dioxygenase (phytanoyl-CoA dioxygenase family)
MNPGENAMGNQDLREQWERDGFFIKRGLVSPLCCAAIEQEVITQIRRDPPERHPGEQVYFSGENYLIYPETAPSQGAAHPEDLISKVFNCHAEQETRRTAESNAVVDVVAELLGSDIDCFQSQFIFKNPGVIGQPWHQDSYYFNFTLQPQVGVWLALSRATLENGCLWVLPGSHREPIHAHIPDRRPSANRGYLEIVDQNFDARQPVLMEPGDVLFFHSFLMHMSMDNVADYRRSAMVYHYGRASTQIMPGLPADRMASLKAANRWIPVRRGISTISSSGSKNVSERPQ